MALNSGVAYDENLARRIRDLLNDEPALTEQRMFGGLAFLIAGNLAVAASSGGGLLVRVDPEESEMLLGSSGVRRMEMRGREMKGWLRVGREDLVARGALARWVSLGRAYARSLPPKG